MPRADSRHEKQLTCQNQGLIAESTDHYVILSVSQEFKKHMTVLRRMVRVALRSTMTTSSISHNARDNTVLDSVKSL